MEWAARPNRGMQKGLWKEARRMPATVGDCSPALVGGCSTRWGAKGAVEGG